MACAVLRCLGPSQARLCWEIETKTTTPNLFPPPKKKIKRLSRKYTISTAEISHPRSSASSSLLVTVWSVLSFPTVANPAIVLAPARRSLCPEGNPPPVLSSPNNLEQSPSQLRIGPLLCDKRLSTESIPSLSSPKPLITLAYHPQGPFPRSCARPRPTRHSGLIKPASPQRPQPWPPRPSSIVNIRCRRPLASRRNTSSSRRSSSSNSIRTILNSSRSCSNNSSSSPSRNSRCHTKLLRGLPISALLSNRIPAGRELSVSLKSRIRAPVART